VTTAATADYSDEMIYAGLAIDIPNYASAVVTAEEVVDPISYGAFAGPARRSLTTYLSHG
jgi:hypothetical protein